MPPPAVPDDEFVRLANTLKSPTAVARALNITVRSVSGRMSRMEERGQRFEVANKRSHRSVPDANPARLHKKIDNGIVLVGSDAHYFPGEPTVAHTAFVKLIRELKPCVVMMNGDVFDGATISRWPRIGWDNKPTVKQELDICTERLDEIYGASPRAAHVWSLGNHDARFETYLAANAPEYEGVKGFHLKDNFPEWKPCWSFFINECTVIKHRFKGGIHAAHNNTLWGGRTMVTGHLHSLKVMPFTDYNGTRYGVDSGTLAEPNGEHVVDYSEDNPKNHRSGFVVLTYHKGILLPPELCEVRDDIGAVFRGRLV